MIHYKTTFHVVPGVPSNVIVNKNGTAVMLTWQKPLKSNGDILEYQIYYYGFKSDVLTVSVHELYICGS